MLLRGQVRIEQRAGFPTDHKDVFTRCHDVTDLRIHGRDADQLEAGRGLLGDGGLYHAAE